MIKLLKKLRRDEKGVTLVEYGIALILALMVGGGALATLAGDINLQLGRGSSCLTTTGATC